MVETPAIVVLTCGTNNCGTAATVVCVDAATVELVCGPVLDVEDVEELTDVVVVAIAVVVDATVVEVVEVVVVVGATVVEVVVVVVVVVVGAVPTPFSNAPMS